MCSRNSFESRDSDLDFEQALQPAMRLLLRFGDVELVAALVQPVRGDAGLGDAMHVLRADLRFERRAERTEQRGVQRLVAVGLRDRDVVLELARDRLVQAVQDAERGVAGGHVLDQDAHAVDVEHLRERVVLFAHLLVHAVHRLFAAAHRRRDAAPSFRPSRIDCRMRFITSRRLPRAALIGFASTR